MKSLQFLISVFVLFLYLGILSCEDDNQKNDKQKPLKITDLSHTDCKKNTTKMDIPKEYLEFISEGKYLNVKHINTMFNCCPGELLVESQINTDTISINEDEKESGCKCICPYDLKYKVGTLEYGKYHIVLQKKDETACEFDLEFNQNTNQIVDLKTGKCKTKN